MPAVGQKMLGTPALAYLLMNSVETTDKRFEVECLVGGALSESSACKTVVCAMPSNTKSCEGEFHNQEKTT